MFSEYKKSYFQSDVAKLNSEIATLRPRLESAESALEDASSSRDRFRVQMRKMAAQIVALEREKAQLRDALEKTGGVFPNRAHVAPDSSSLMMDVSSAFRGSERSTATSSGTFLLRVRVKIRRRSRRRREHRPRSKRTRIFAGKSERKNTNESFFFYSRSSRCKLALSKD